jgi:hypothetical protein
MVLHMSALDFQNENFQAISTYVVLMLTTGAGQCGATPRLRPKPRMRSQR